MSLTESLPITLHANQEHSRLRLVVLLLMPVAVALGYLLVNWLISLLGGALSEYAIFLSCMWGAPMGLGAVYLVEMGLKRAWPSGDAVILADDALEVRVNGRTQAQLDLGADMVMTNWYFRLAGYPRIGNERRAAKGWYCLASQVQQDDTHVVVYAFLPPAETAVYVQDRPSNPADFYEIKPAVLYERKQSFSRTNPLPTLPPELLRGKDGRFWLAERYRWEVGLELTRKDFARFQTYVNLLLKSDE